MAKVAMMATTTGTTTTNVGASDTETEQTPPNPTIFRDFLSGTAATVHGTQPSASSPPASGTFPLSVSVSVSLSLSLSALALPLPLLICS